MPGLHLRSARRPLELSTFRIAAAEDKIHTELPIPSFLLVLPSFSFLRGKRRVEADLTSPAQPRHSSSPPPSPLSPRRSPPSPPCPSPAKSGSEIDGLRPDGASGRARLRFLRGVRRSERGGGGVRSGCWATRMRTHQRRHNARRSRLVLVHFVLFLVLDTLYNHLAPGSLRNGHAAAFHVRRRGGVGYGCFLSLVIVSLCFSFVSSIFWSTWF
ncbi:hypothetical protein B0H14DRAFT_1575489 [Mycena olivaceomarginata]|nr:hypothetical protein B0H14DRAFT_1575489 [Mycena olivaceomarginata]